jgi:hypothetical protein
MASSNNDSNRTEQRRQHNCMQEQPWMDGTTTTTDNNNTFCKSSFWYTHHQQHHHHHCDDVELEQTLLQPTVTNLLPLDTTASVGTTTNEENDDYNCTYDDIGNYKYRYDWVEEEEIHRSCNDQVMVPFVIRSAAYSG